MKNKNGITLIALVISIIVMLILAGVSINATIGDNGILTKAQDTVFINSCAYLEEYFNQLYATCAMDGNVDGDTPLEVIMNNGYQNYFFETSEGYCLKRSIKNEETGVYENLVFYLIKKDQLPKEIQGQLQGGNASKKLDFRKLSDVYGITSDLQAYYISDGIDTLVGLERSDINADSPDIVAFEQTSTLAQMVNGGTEAITNQGLKSIKTLTIDSQEELSVLPECSKFTNLTTVYFLNLTIPSLAGIEGATNINHIRFTNCGVSDYSALCGLNNLTYLYLITPTGKNEEVATLCSSDKGIASAELSKLQYFGIVGNVTHLQSTSTDYSSNKYDITDVSGLANFTDTTKKAIKYMYLQNLQLTSISSLVDFSNVVVLRLEANALKTFDGIQKMSKLTHLIAPALYSNAEAKYTLGINETATESDTDALKYIYKNASNKNTTLKVVQLNTNTNLKHVEYLSTCTAITTLYLDGCNNLINVDQIASVIAKCGVNYKIPGKYASDTISNTATSLYLAGTLTVSKFEEIMNNTKLTHLSLNGLTITTDAGVKLTTTTSPTYDEEVTKVLSTCTSLQRLQLYNLTYLRTLDFIGSGKVTNLVELDLRNTKNVNDLTILNTYGTKLQILAINNDNIDITTIQSTINHCTGTSAYYLSSGQGGCALLTWNLIKQLENCTELTYFRDWTISSARGQGTDAEGNAKVLDLSGTKIKEFYIRHIYEVDIILPNTIEQSRFIKTKLPTFSANTNNLTYLYMDADRDLSTREEWQVFLNNLGQNCPNLNELIIQVAQNFNFEDLSYLRGLQNLTTFTYYGNSTSEPTYDEAKTSISGIGNLAYLKKLIINNLKNVWDISDLARCTQLEDITIYNTNVANISCVSSMPNLKRLIMYSNSIKDIYPILSCKKLEEVDFRTNLLTDMGYHNTGSGSVAYDTLDVFYSLNQHLEASETLDGISGSLKKVQLKGNTFTDTDLIKSVEWDAALDI